MVSVNEFPIIDTLDLEPIKEKLMHHKAGKGWSPERASAVELEYRRFLCLVKKFPNEPIAPVVDVDEFWHCHILDTKKYADDCQRIFGYFLHHFPYAGMRGKEDEEALQRIGVRTADIYEQTFGVAYMSSLTAIGEQPRTAMSAPVRLSTAYGAPAEAAYCYVTAAKPAYCYVTAAKPAYCYVPPAKPAYCYVTAAKPAYCYVTSGDEDSFATFDQLASSANWTREAASAARKPAYCGAGTEQAPTLRTWPPELRTGFYLERPTLPVA